MDIDDKQSDRLLTFEVSKTNDQEVTVRPGFNVSLGLSRLSHRQLRHPQGLSLPLVNSVHGY